MNPKLLSCAAILIIVNFTACKTTIYPGEVGFVIRKGVIKPGILNPGRHHFNPFTSRICRFNTRITEFSTIMSPPTKEGLEVKVDLTALYHIDPQAAPALYTNVGMDYGKKIVVNNFMAIVREYTMTYTAVELLNQRETIEKMIEDELKVAISPYGIVLDDVLIKDIDMPNEVLAAIENNAKAEQIAKQTKLEIEARRAQEEFELETKEKELKFSLEKQRADSLIMQIEANAIKNYQNTINPSLNDKVLRFRSIEATRDLMKSPNTKVIISDGKTLMVNNGGDK